MADFYDSIELDGVMKPIKDTDAARSSELEAVETALDGKYSKTGGTISGDVTIDGARLTVKHGAHGVQTLPNAADTGNNYVVSDTDLFVQVGSDDPEPLTVKASGVNLSDGTDPILVIGVDYPVDEHDAANKGYVDGQAAAAKTYTDGQIALVDAAKVDKTEIESTTPTSISSEYLTNLTNARYRYMRVGSMVFALFSAVVSSTTSYGLIAAEGLTGLPTPEKEPGTIGLYTIGTAAFCDFDSSYTPSSTDSATWSTSGIRVTIAGHVGDAFTLSFLYRTEVNEDDD